MGTLRLCQSTTGSSFRKNRKWEFLKKIKKWPGFLKEELKKTDCVTAKVIELRINDHKRVFRTWFKKNLVFHKYELMGRLLRQSKRF